MISNAMSLKNAAGSVVPFVKTQAAWVISGITRFASLIVGPIASMVLKISAFASRHLEPVGRLLSPVITWARNNRLATGLGAMGVGIGATMAKYFPCSKGRRGGCKEPVTNAPLPPTSQAQTPSAASTPTASGSQAPAPTDD